MRLRAANITGTITDNPLTSGATTVNAACLAALPALTAGDDYYAASIESDGDDPEIVYITAHTASATSATIIRGKEETSGIEHVTGVSFFVGPTALDFMGVDIFSSLDFPKHTDDTPDDDFAGTSLDGKWTVVDGTATTVDPLTTAADPIENYEVNDGLYGQGWGTGLILLRQDYELPDGNCIIVKFSAPLAVPLGGEDSGSARVLLGLNNSDTGLIDGVDEDYMQIWNDGRISKYDAGTARSTAHIVPTAKTMYMGVYRDGSAYSGMYSLDGFIWLTFHDGHAPGSTHNNIWLDVYNSQTTTTHPAPVAKIHWIRLGGSGLRPW